MELTKKEIQEIQRVAREAARKEFQALQKKANDKKLNDTKEIMKQYRDAMFHLRHIKPETEKNEISSKYLNRLESANANTRAIIKNVDRALAEIARRREADGRQQEYRAFQLHYIEGLSYDKTLEQLERETGQQIGKVTPNRWCDGIIAELAILLWGI